MSNFDEDDDDFLKLRLGQPSSSSSPRSKTSAAPNPNSYYLTEPPSQTLILPPQTPRLQQEQQQNSATTTTFPWGFEALPNVRVSYLQPAAAAARVSSSCATMEAIPVQMEQPVTPDQAPPPVQPPRVQTSLPIGKTEFVPPPFPWATSKRATVHSMAHLLSNEITRIGGEVQCRSCHHKYWMEYDLQEKFNEVSNYIVNNWASFHDRAPPAWTNPSYPNCRNCKQEGSVRAVMGEKKKTINWLFLFLGQLLGCCTLGHLRYFCKHTSNHRTGAKDRLLYLTYLELRHQLHPTIDAPLPNRPHP